MNVGSAAVVGSGRGIVVVGVCGGIRRGAPSRVAITGVYDGVDVKVICEPASDRIITGHPYK